MAYGDWSIQDVRNAIEGAKQKGENEVTLDMEHNSYENEQMVLKWLKENGYDAELGMERMYIRNLDQPRTIERMG